MHPINCSALMMGLMFHGTILQGIEMYMSSGVDKTTKDEVNPASFRCLL
ncbi:hypothetical protein Hanom_Chr12g01170431 [Helianthus anomalus]